MNIDTPPAPSSVSLLAPVLVAANDLLWRHVFSPGSAPGESAIAQREVQSAVCAVLGSGELADHFFPRRPLLMPELHAAMRSERASANRLAKIVAQDPVLVADMLRLANSGFYNTSSTPVETLQRAIAICGNDGLQSLAATALMQPVFRGGKEEVYANFPPLLWERSARAARAATLYAQHTRCCDYSAAQLVTLLAALGPLVAFRATVRQYEEAPGLEPHGAVFIALVETLGRSLSQQLALRWNSSERLVAALGIEAEMVAVEGAAELAIALDCGELFGTLSLLASEQILTEEACRQMLVQAGLPREIHETVWAGLLPAHARQDQPGR
ncbi:MAG: HDOD domain-containing protein [bacterium]|nr:HDOD domain-containing protein [bacterium]